MQNIMVLVGGGIKNEDVVENWKWGKHKGRQFHEDGVKGLKIAYP